MPDQSPIPSPDQFNEESYYQAIALEENELTQSEFVPIPIDQENHFNNLHSFHLTQLNTNTTDPRILFPSSPVLSCGSNRSNYISLVSPVSSNISLSSLIMSRHSDSRQNKCYVCTKSYPTKIDELLDDQETSVYYPHRIGSSILICGRKSSSFPYQLFVGPDWPCMCITYCLIIGPTALFINNIGRHYGPGVIFLTLFLLLVTLSFYSFTACSDPGIVFLSISDRDDIELGRKSSEVTNIATTNASGHHAVHLESPGGSSDGKEESSDHITSGLQTIGSNSNIIENSYVKGNNNNKANGKIECGLCQIQRPRNAFHCHDCGVCIEELDHHCPWTGKCIGKKTLKTFYGFLWSLTFLIGFVILMVIITAARDSPVFNTK